MTAPTPAAARAAASAPPRGVPQWLAARTDVVLVVAVWAAILVPQLVESLSGTKGFEAVTEAPAAPSAVVEAVTTAANAALVLVCAAAVVLGWRGIDRRRLPVLVVLLTPWLLVVGHLAAVGRPPGAAAAVLWPAIAGAFWVVRPGRGAAQAVGYLTGLTAAVSLVLGAFLPDAGRYPAAAAGIEKAVGPLGVLAGVMPSGNNLGLLLVVGLPAVLVIARRGLRWSALGAVLLALAWTMSRTSWVAAAVVLAALALVSLRRRPAAVAAGGLGLLAAAGIVLPFVATDPTAFANRAGYWIPTLDAWRESPLTGYGADYFKRLAASTENLGAHAFQAHNQWVQLLVTGGLLLTVAVVALLSAAAARAVRLAGDGVIWAAGWLAAVLTVGLLEVPLGFVDRTVFWPVTLVPLCLVLCGRLAAAPTRAAAHE